MVKTTTHTDEGEERTMTKCNNCGILKNETSEEFYKYCKKTYCYACLEEYYNDELSAFYFNEFVNIECEEIE